MMNRIFLTLPILATTFLCFNSYADNTFYGKANLTLNDFKQQSSGAGVDEWQLNSNASRLGVRGTHAISDGFEAIYQLEYEVQIDDGKSVASKGKDTLEQRNSYLGLRGGFGEIIAGKHDTPMKLTTNRLDRFNDQVLGDIKNYMEGEDRLSNVVMYTSPTLKGFFARAAFIPAEDSAGSSGDGGLADGTSYSLNYSSQLLSAAIIRNTDVDSQDTTRAVADFTLGKTKLGGLWQEADKTDGSASEDSWFISATHDLSTNWRLKSQYGNTDYGNGRKDTQSAIGVDRILNSDTIIFVNYIQIERDSPQLSDKDSSFAVGLELSF
jgi:predicted porin